ncbi:M23 family metallopeptidase [Oscillatoria sp. CS-180]|uniref:M23 family metallopeptidase n=1 Tax=Oscillatoria sp. CS-180 TaxID=3021720 RepID=UPI00232B2DE1|nr:M23 family metallopeptidase [Oscillatoria sp. CS-180]MDB9525890.1 M23 family metallopeptidase [Oscillatoria sp. CS-180]
MRLRLPRPYTILITRTGETPIAISLRPFPIVLVGLALSSLPVVWVAKLIGDNEQLTQRNENLTETASEVLLELETLDSEVEDLRERAGLPEEGTPPSQSVLERSQGGIEQPADAERLFQMAQTRLPQIDLELEAQVRPALEDTLAEESARAAALPNAKPLKGNLDVSSEFGIRRNPFGGFNYEMHSGIDFRGPVGTPVYATADGTVIRAEHSGGYGKHIVIDHGYDYETLYAHLSNIQVQTGDRIKRGDLIGALGSTGRSSGPHLHYEVHRDHKPINPRYYLRIEESVD